MARISKRRMNTTTPYTTTYRYLQGAKPGTTTTMVEQMQQGNQTISYTYDNVGSIKTIAEDGVCKVSYLYDEIGQLIREDNNWINQTVTYHYDVGGNLLERNEYAYTTGLLGEILHQTGYQYEDTNWKDKLTKYKGQNMTYDAIGNPLTYRDNIQMTWENGRELSTLSQGALSMSFQYDCGGIRTRKIVDGVETRYYLKGSQIQTQITGEERLDFLYDEQEQLLGVQTGEETFYYVRNMQQDIIGILDREGTQVVFYAYDSWGKLVAVTGSKKDSIGQKNPFRYRGYYYDVETGLYSLHSRYYDPITGRFLNADGTIGANKDILSNNLFTYCSNNPVNLCDPTGKAAVWVELGFVYDVTWSDFHRAEQGLPPIAYQEWLRSNNTANVNKTVVEAQGISKKIKSATYISPSKTKDVYVKKSKKVISPDKVDAASWAAGGIASTKIVAKKLPYLGLAIWTLDGIRMYNGQMDKMDLESYESAMNKGTGVIIIEWAIEGAPSGNGSWTSYSSWNGSDDLSF